MSNHRKEIITRVQNADLKLNLVVVHELTNLRIYGFMDLWVYGFTYYFFLWRSATLCADHNLPRWHMFESAPYSVHAT